jgi:hypothetical protein
MLDAADQSGPRPAERAVFVRRSANFAAMVILVRPLHRPGGTKTGH